jgi:hypothetical protein
MESEDSMKFPYTIIIPRLRFILFICTVLVFTNSCVSSRIISKSHEDKNQPQKPIESFYLKPIIVTAFNFFEDGEIGYIMDKKLDFALRNIEGMTFKKSADQRDYSIEPELIIKTFEEKYRVKNYYLLNVRVLLDERIIFQYTYEYNGPASIFDGRVQSAMIERFIRDIKKHTS